MENHAETIRELRELAEIAAKSPIHRDVVISVLKLNKIIDIADENEALKNALRKAKFRFARLHDLADGGVGICEIDTKRPKK